MQNIARALLNAASFLELSGEDVLELHAAVKAMEQIAFDLGNATPEEAALLTDTARELAEESRAAGPGFTDAVTFFETFMENFGVGAARE